MVQDGEQQILDWKDPSTRHLAHKHIYVHGQHLYCIFRTVVMASPTQMAPFPHPLQNSSSRSGSDSKESGNGRGNGSGSGSSSITGNKLQCHTATSPQPHLRRLQCATTIINAANTNTITTTTATFATIRATLSLFCQFLTVFCILLTATGCVRMARAQDDPLTATNAVTAPGYLNAQPSYADAMPSAFYCPAEGLYADDYDCRIYYRCEAKTNDYIKAYAFACKVGTVFSRKLRLCMPPQLAGREECNDYMNEIDTDNGDNGEDGQQLPLLTYGIANNGNGIHATASNTAAADGADADAVNAAVTRGQLQNYGLSGLGGVSVISFSTSAARSADGSRAADEQGPPCEDDGFMSDPDDCTIFYRCISNGRSFNKIGFRCADGTAWDGVMESCNHIHNVRARGGCQGKADNLVLADYAADTTQSSQTNYQNTTSSSSNSSQQSSTSSSSNSSSSSTSSSSSSNSTSSNATSGTAATGNQQQTGTQSSSTESSSSNSQSQSSTQSSSSSSQQSSGSSTSSSSNSTSNQGSENSQVGNQSSSNNQSSGEGSQSSANNQSSSSNQSGGGNQEGSNNQSNAN
ncbi:PREDICTED: uncharacterized protein DDB_G0271670-like, partial [Rhagoletis zephyria]|uniref:uncharacterized protein DDB_G0271670-like n=1 Tax=Rhagoletis zephyria TaxID=28612 RepID=UPI0008114FA5